MAREVSVLVVSAALSIACQQGPGRQDADDLDDDSASGRAAAAPRGALRGSEGFEAAGQAGPIDDGRDPQADEPRHGISTPGGRDGAPSTVQDPDAREALPISPVDARILDGALHVTCETCAEASGSVALPYRRVRITVTGDDHVATELRDLRAMTPVALVQSDGSPLADGLYEYEVQPEVDLVSGDGAAADEPNDAVGRNALDPAVAERARLPVVSKKTGAFSVVAGALVDPSAEEPPTQN